MKMTYKPNAATPKLKFAWVMMELLQHEQRIVYLDMWVMPLDGLKKKKCVTPLFSFFFTRSKATERNFITTITTYSSVFMKMAGQIFTITERQLLDEIWMLRNAININHFDQTVVRRGLKLTKRKIAMQRMRILEAEIWGPQDDGMFRCSGIESNHEYPIRDFVLTFIKMFVKNLKDLCDRELENHVNTYPSLELVEE